MRLLKTYILLPTGHGLLIYRRRGVRGEIKLLATRSADNVVGVAEVICADMPSLNCDIGMMVERLCPLIEIAQGTNTMAYISNRDVLNWHSFLKKEVNCESEPV